MGGHTISIIFNSAEEALEYLTSVNQSIKEGYGLTLESFELVTDGNVCTLGARWGK